MTVAVTQPLDWHQWVGYLEIERSGGGDGRSSPRYERGTATLVTSRVVITARHVLWPANETLIEPTQYSLRLIADAKDLAGRGEEAKEEDVPVLRCRPLWNAGAEPDVKGLDVALLELEVPRDPGVETGGSGVALPRMVFAPESPRGQRRWESAGFARCRTARQGDRSFPVPLPLKGEVYAQPWIDLELGVDDPPRPLAEERGASGLWAGISGALVVCDGAIRGVVRGDRPRTAEGRLVATPMTHCLQHARFCELLGIHLEKEDRIRRVTGRLAEILVRHATLRQRLHAELCHERARQSVTQVCESVAAAIVHAPILDFLKVLRRLQRELLAVDHADADGVVNLLSRALPALADAGFVQSARQSVVAGTGFVSIPAATPTMAEVMMAAAHGRDAALRPAETGSYPRSRYAVEAFSNQSPRQGMVEDPLDLILDEIIQAMGLSDPWDRDLCVEDRLDRVRGALEADDHSAVGAPWFIVFRSRTGSDAEEQRERLFGRVREELPELTLVEIVAPRSRRNQEEYTMADLLKQMIEGER